MNSNFSYLQLEEKHLKDLQFLILNVFKKFFSIEHLKMKYLQNDDLGTVATIAYDGLRPIGFYGAIVQLFLHQGSEIRVAHACDSYTQQEYQGQSVHFHLANLSYEFMRTQKISFVYAFHSENTYHSTKKLNWKENGEMARFHIYTGSFPIAKIYKKLNFHKTVQKRVKKVISAFIKTDFKYQSFLSHQIMDNSFFKYKNQLFAHHIIEINQCIFYIKVDSIMHVGFFTFPNLKILADALVKLTELAYKMSVSEILFQCSRNSNMFRGIKSYKEPLPSWKIGYLLFEEIEIKEFEFTFANLDTF